MTLPALDFETFSAAGFCFNPETGKHEAPRGARSKGLPVVGTAVYTEHPTFEVLTASYDLADGRGVRRWRPGEPNPHDLFDHLARGGLLETHNLMFEYLCWENGCTRLYGWPSLAPYVAQLRCSAAKARVASLPGALGNLAAVLGTTGKDKEGTRLMKVFSMPRDPTKKDPRRRILPADDPVQFEAYRAYCDQDVRAEGEASGATPAMSDDELVFWMVDQEINRRGIAIDRPALRDCMAVLEQALDVYGEEFRALTGGLDPTQLQATRGWLAAHGVNLPAMDEAAIDDALASLPPHPPGGQWAPRRVLEIRQLIGSASVKKLYAMEHQANRADRLLNLIIHHGARTGRPTGEGPQPLNLPRAGPDVAWCPDAGCGKPFARKHTACPWCGAGAASARRGKWSAECVDPVLEIMATRSLALVEWFFGDALLSISGCLRGLFVAGPGMDLIASDYSAIEAVVIAMLAGEQWRIDAFRRGDPIYLVGASKITGRSLDEYLAYHAAHGEHHPDRQTIGKVSELACFTAETQVLTRRGYVAIVDVRLDDQLWDGTEWVSHAGVIAKGERDVLRLDGIETTPDHKIICGGSWREARQLASRPSMLSRALASGSANLPWSAKSPAASCASPARAAPHTTQSPSSISSKASRPGATLAPSVRRARRVKTSGHTPILCRTTRIDADCLTASPRALLGASLRDTPTTGAAAFAFTPRGLTAPPAVAPSSRIWSRSTDGTNPPSNSTGSKRMATTRRETFASSRSKRTTETAGRSKRCSGVSTTLKPVFDIAYAGPRNRFTIRTDSGHLIVHNCGFGGWIGSYKAFGSTEPDDVIKQQILAWRAASPAIVDLWGGQFRGLPWDRDRRPELFGYEGMAIAAIQNPGAVYNWRGVRFYMRDTSIGHALTIRLLSGRELTYHQPRLYPSARRPDELSIVYMGWNSNPKYGAMGWVPIETYGGRLAENIVQATAHDVLRYGILGLRAAGYPTVLHVYDEIVVEVPAGTGSVEEVERIMSTMPPWAYDDVGPWPISAGGGWRGRRYRKG